MINKNLELHSFFGTCCILQARMMILTQKRRWVGIFPAVTSKNWDNTSTHEDTIASNFFLLRNNVESKLATMGAALVYYGVFLCATTILILVLPRPQVATCAAAVEALKVKLESMEKAPQQ